MNYHARSPGWAPGDPKKKYRNDDHESASGHKVNDSVTEFYSDLAPLYHLVYEDWHASIQRQSRMLDSVIQERWPEAREILDLSCGIGTQALGLAQLDYVVTASDLTPEAVERARKEASALGLSVGFSVADMRDASMHHGRQFDVVLAGDNSVPHLLTDDQILEAFRAMYQCARPGGGCVISVRDYAVEDVSGSGNIKMYGTRQVDGITYIVFQKWDVDGAFYDLTMYFVEDDGSAACQTRVMRSRYYAIGVPRLCELMGEAGFESVTRVDGRFFEPLIVGTRKK